MLPPTIQAVLFDVGNTLLYFEGDWEMMYAEADLALALALHEMLPGLNTAAFIRAFRQRLTAYYIQREIDLEEHTTGQVLRLTLGEVGWSNLPEATIPRALQAYYGVSQTYWLADPEAAPTLAALRARGCRLGVISNAANDQDVEDLIAKAGLREYLDFVLTSAAFGVRKPDPRIFQAALGRWGLRPEQAAMVGDTLEADILGANQVGIFSVWLTRWVEKRTASAIRPRAEIERLGELVSFCEK